MELLIISRRSKSRTCQAWQVFVSDSLRRKKSHGSFPKFPPSFPNHQQGKHSKKIQIFPSAQQDFGAKCEEPSPTIRNVDRHQGWFCPAPLQRDWEHNDLEKHHNPMADPPSMLCICRTPKIKRNQGQLQHPSRRK